PKPLDDLGPDLGAMVLAVLHSELSQLNAGIDQRMQFDPKVATEPIKEREFVTHIFEQTGVGLPESTIERELRYGAFSGRNVRFQPAYTESIYAWVAAPFPLSHIMTDCPTIRLYGIDLGTDGAHLIIDPLRDNADLFKPFISEHLNEVANPSLYFFSVDRIRGHIRDRCGNWFKERPDFTEVTYRATLERTKTWFGEPYG